ncbi:hypothetical protein [Pelagicoccus sp. SDUM812003]|uniref:hypothetical protein n=1 Tax=Pelagicoccus sp. SDUM812003 TaxID=3041267 RepID=UPI00280C8810|nr:hypothetical protein [Pelagicoccus sp. SDUM812003]MDQ8204540.1 hypothetical protein [Pelagicoccus sp. SDUM812003]
MPDDKDLDEVMDRWDADFRSDSNLAFRVVAEGARRQRAQGATDSLIDWLKTALERPGLAAAFAILFILVGVGIGQFLQLRARSTEEDLTLTYRLTIDPLYRLKAVAGVDDLNSSDALKSPRLTEEQANVLLSSLGWLQGELGLSEPQYEKISALHSDYEREFDALFVELIQSHQAYQEIDSKRLANDVIDYFELYQLLQEQRRLSEESSRLTSELMQKVSQIIEPAQRERYRKLLHNVYPNFAKAGDARRDV